MVNGILTIPLAGKILRDSRDSSVTAQPLSEFVAGPENALAVHALRPYLERTATDAKSALLFGPLVLYGPHGSGKSHLARGLCDWWLEHFPAERALCLSAAEFAQEYAAALKDQCLDAWRRRIRGLALLVIEDVAHLGGKRGAQQELLHTLDALAQCDAQIVITSRYLPTHLSVLSPALRSRLSAGLAVPLSLPASATRRAILERLATARGVSLPKRALHGLADGLNVSAGALVAALLELEFRSAASGDAVDHDHVRQFVAEQGSARMPSVRDIAYLTAKYFGLKLADMKSPLRRQPLVAGRGVAMYLARLLTDQSLEKIGRFFGGRDHTTVLHGCRRTEHLLKQDRATRQAVSELKRLLLAS